MAVDAQTVLDITESVLEQWALSAEFFGHSDNADNFRKIAAQINYLTKLLEEKDASTVH